MRSSLRSVRCLIGQNPWPTYPLMAVADMLLMLRLMRPKLSVRIPPSRIPMLSRKLSNTLTSLSGMKVRIPGWHHSENNGHSHKLTLIQHEKKNQKNSKYSVGACKTQEQRTKQFLNNQNDPFIGLNETNEKHSKGRKETPSRVLQNRKCRLHKKWEESLKGKKDNNKQGR